MLLLILVLSYWPSISYSDDSILNDHGKTVAPTKSNEISMIEEEVIITRTTYSGIHVKCTFLFKNTSEKLIKATVGFPGNEYFTEHPSNTLTDFVTVIDGKRLKIKTKNEIVEETKNDNPPMFRNWYTWEMKFPPKSTVKVENTYGCGLSIAQLYGPNCLYYELSTGANWNGKIGKATIKIIYDSAEELENNVCEINPKGWVRNDNKIIWEFKDIKPTEADNIAICERGDNGGNPTVKLKPLFFKKEETTPQTNNDKLFQAAQDGDLSAINSALDDGADINLNNAYYGRTALVLASQNGHADVVKLLLDKGADVNGKDTNGSTALISASWNGHVDVVKLLLDKGADVNLKNTSGATAFSIASQNGHPDVVMVLIDKGADVDAKANDSAVAFINASLKGRTDVAKLLLDKGVDVNVKATSYGRTALMVAASRGHADVVKLLLDKGADVNVKDVNGKSAFMFASQKGHADIVEMLRKAGARE